MTARRLDFCAVPTLVGTPAVEYGEDTEDSVH